MEIFCFNFSLSNQWRETKYFELVSDTWRNRDPEQICWRIWRNMKMDDWNFQQGIHGRGIKIDNQFDSPCQTIDFFQHLTSRCSLRRHHELSFSLRWACIYLSLYCIPCLLLTILEKKSRLPFKISSCYSLSHEVVIGSQSWVVTHFPM